MKEWYGISQLEILRYSLLDLQRFENEWRIKNFKLLCEIKVLENKLLKMENKMIDGDTQKQMTGECSVYPAGHQINYVSEESSISVDVWECACGFRVVQNQDCGAGA